MSTELTGERVLADGQKLQHTAVADLDVVRPNMLRARMVSARSARELFFDGKTVTLFTPAQKYYSTVEFTDNIGGLINKLEERYGVDIPLADLFLWGTPAAPLDKIDSAMNAGQDFIDDDLCNHYAFRQGNFDWQIWITTGSKPLPRKLVITNRADEARPQSVSLMEWNLKPTFTDAVFKFTPPKGATAVEPVSYTHLDVYKRQVQGLPIILVPLWQAIHRAPAADRRSFALALLLYVAAKAAELHDHELFDILGWISGHTLKHLLATGAAAVLVNRLVQRVWEAAKGRSLG